MNFKILSLLSLLFLVENLAYSNSNDDLLKAVREHNLDDVIQALSNGADVNHLFEYPLGSTRPLIAASMIESQESLPIRLRIIQTLLSEGADVNASGMDHDQLRTPLSMAITGAQPEVVALLLLQPDIKVKESDIDKAHGYVAYDEEEIEKELAKNPEGSKYLDYLKTFHERYSRIERMLADHSSLK